MSKSMLYSSRKRENHYYCVCFYFLYENENTWETRDGKKKEKKKKKIEIKWKKKSKKWIVSVYFVNVRTQKLIVKMKKKLQQQNTFSLVDARVVSGFRDLKGV